MWTLRTQVLVGLQLEFRTDAFRAYIEPQILNNIERELRSQAQGSRTLTLKDTSVDEPRTTNQNKVCR